MEEKVESSKKCFKILSIDGGGIRGILPAQFLSEIEAQIKQDTGEEIRTCDYFDLICGTSTGGILAIALGMGFSASEIANLYLNNAKSIFGRKWNNPFRLNIFTTKHSRKTLESILKDVFKHKSENRELLIGDSKTRLCIPVYDIKMGCLNVLKTRHHPKLHRDYLIPAYQAAMSTSAAPTYFNPYTLNYKGVGDLPIIEKNKVDGGVCINNPVMVGFIEAINTLDVPVENLKILSLGTGIRKFSIDKSSVGWGVAKWMWKGRLIEAFMQSQTAVIDNQIKYFNEGIGESIKSTFLYKRIQHEFSSIKTSVEMDEFRKNKLRKLVDIAQGFAKTDGSFVIEEFFKNKIKSYKNG